jgi:hypothetical protein
LQHASQYSVTQEKLKLPVESGISQDEGFGATVGGWVHEMLEINAAMRPSALDLLSRFNLSQGKEVKDSKLPRVKVEVLNIY